MPVPRGTARTVPNGTAQNPSRYSGASNRSMDRREGERRVAPHSQLSPHAKRTTREILRSLGQFFPERPVPDPGGPTLARGCSLTVVSGWQVGGGRVDQRNHAAGLARPVRQRPDQQAAGRPPVGPPLGGKVSHRARFTGSDVFDEDTPATRALATFSTGTKSRTCRPDVIGKSRPSRAACLRAGQRRCGASPSPNTTHGLSTSPSTRSEAATPCRAIVAAAFDAAYGPSGSGAVVAGTKS